MTTRAFCIANLSLQEILPEQKPWENREPIPPLPSKDAYRAWCNNPGTNHLFLSLVEAEVTSLRVNAENKPYRLHGICADYDSPGTTPEEVKKGIGRIPAQYPPFAYNSTFSRGVRVVWMFENPVFYYSKDVYEKFMARAIKELKLRSILPGLDDSITKPDQFYCAGNNWTLAQSGHGIIRSTILDLWMFDACKVDHFRSSGVEVPLTIVEAEIAKKYPGRWTGDFAEGSRGVRFWDPTGDAKSALVKKTGMVAFTGNDPFLSWEKLFGREFIQAYLEDRRGKTINEMFSDGDAYYRQLPNQRWDCIAVEATRRHLKVHYGLSDRVMKDEDASEIDTVLNHLEMRKRVKGALPFPLNPQLVVDWNGERFINDSTARLWPAHPEPQEWGVNFPWISGYLSTLFLDERNLGAFLSWLHVWMKSAHSGQPCRGQSLFLVGPPGTGKTLLSRQIVARMVGGYADGRDHLVDGGRFNSTMFEKALWCIDDSTVLAEGKMHARFSSLVKAVVANDSFQYEQKYGYSGACPFVGRLMVTLNDDPISLAILPDADQSLLDKAIMAKTDSVEADVAEHEADRYLIIERELSAFVRWVIDFEMPAWIERDPRFGIKAWHDEDVLSEARAVSPSRMLLDVVDSWRRGISFSDPLNKETEWEGTLSELYKLLCGEYRELISRVSPALMSRQISQSINLGCDWIERRRRGKTRERILAIKLVKGKS